MSLRKERARRCIHCSYRKSISDDSRYMGFCTRYERFVPDSLCGCDHTKDGKTILWNFERKTDNEHEEDRQRSQN